MKPKRTLAWKLGLFVLAAAPWTSAFYAYNQATAADIQRPPYQVIAYNDLGMHCMNEDFSELCILPPFNTMRVQVIKRGNNPDVMDGDFNVTYSIPGNTISTTKTNFWDFAPMLFGVQLPPNIGLTSHGLAGTMSRNTTLKYWEVTGVPITPVMDSGTPNAYPLALINARRNGIDYKTQAVMPVSWEISCNLCHIPAKGQSVAHDILADHDRLHNTDLVNQKPVLCASCHADPALGTPGVPGVSPMSTAMHGAHASRMSQTTIENPCYACHPGVNTDCQRDNHKARGITCTNCHGGMEAVGSTTRTPWVDQPKCSNCHNRPNHDYEEPGKLYKDSRGHGGVMCAVCHGSPHAMGPSTNAVDNLQAIRLQGKAGPLKTCYVCHTKIPSEPFPHKFDD